MSNGLLIVLEGIDGCGKGTQMKRLANNLFDANKRHHVFMTREPGRSQMGAEIRKMLTSITDPYSKGLEYCKFFTGDRKEHGPVIEAVRAYGGIVASDRYWESTLAFQQTQGVSVETIIAMHEGVIRPDLTLIFDLPADIAMDRLKDRPGVKESVERIDFQEKLRGLYLGLPDLLKTQTIKIIDANRNPDEIEIDMMREIWPYLEKVK